MTRLITALAVFLCLVAKPALGQNPPAKLKPKPAEAKAADWLINMAEAKASAQRLRKPLLVRFETSGSPWCEKLAEIFGQPELQVELGHWVLVVLSADEPSRETRALAVATTPALRALAPTGRLVGAYDGFAPAPQLKAWLREQLDKATANPADDLLTDDRPDLVGVVRLVAEFRSRDAVAREAAIRRLAPYPDVAAQPVTEAFATGSLQARLTALELLQLWQAPLANLDPWRPESLAKAPLDALRTWALKPKLKSLPEPAPEAWLAIKKDLARVADADEADALVLRERLARHGAKLMPQVVAKIKNAQTDAVRERYTALRYRLAASAALALNWPGGLERLAATSAATRRAALKELETRVKARDEPLLLELFSSPDALVREFSLRALKEITGTNAAGTLVKLLEDPEPNVRAAVLKQLAQTPSPQLVPKLVDYVSTETDTDLLVHSIRALREAPDKRSAAALEKLLGNKSWQVRAEAAEALEKFLDPYGKAEEWQADIAVAMMKLLNDPDGFVVSRAIPVVGRLDMKETVQPLIDVIARHPDLAEVAVKELAHRSKSADSAIPALRGLCAAKRPEIRAAALIGLAALSFNADRGARSTVPENAINGDALLRIHPELTAALKDEAASVRIAAAKAVVGYCGDFYFRVGADPQKSRRDWLDAARHDKKRLGWLMDIATRLLPSLTSAERDERFYGALALIMLGKTDEALPVLRAAIKQQPQLISHGAQALEWLEWDKRVGMFRELVDARPGDDLLADVVNHFAAVPDDRAIDELWQVLLRKDAGIATAAGVAQGLQRLYYEDQLNTHYNGQLKISAATRKHVLQSVVPRLRSGSELQKVAAMTLLLPADAQQTHKLAGEILADKSAGPKLKRDAFQVQLLALPAAAAQRQTIDGLHHEVEDIRVLALRMLAGAGENLAALRDGQIPTVAGMYSYDERLSSAQAETIAVKPPKGLKREMVRPFLRSDNREIAGLAGYLMTLLGEPSGLAAVEDYWRQKARDNDYWLRRVYRAIAALKDDAQVPTLEEVYQILSAQGPYNVREFYWTIRGMEGPKALDLRKRIRREVGMDNLR